MEIMHVNGHVEVYEDGVFVFSADTKAEALRELREMEEKNEGLSDYPQI